MKNFIESRALRGLGLLLLVSAYLQGGLRKLLDFAGAVGEMHHFGLEPAVPMAVAVIVLELVASALVVSGRWRWLGALALAAFTLGATFIANAFWNAPPAERFMLENAFFEHLGLAGAFLLVARHDWLQRRSHCAAKRV